MANFYNQATLAYNGKTVNSNITVGEIVEKITVYEAKFTVELKSGTSVDINR